MKKLVIAISLVSTSFCSLAKWELPPSSNFISKNQSTAHAQQAESISTNKKIYLSNELIELTYRYTNKTNAENVEFDLTLAENNQFIAEDNILTPTSTLFNLTTDTQTIHWQGVLAKPQLGFVTFDDDFFGYIPLEETFGISARSCGVTCTNDVWPWNVNFIFHGEEITRVYLTKEGKILFNDPNIENQANSDLSQANIAPLFSTFEYQDAELRIAEIKHPETEDVFVVFEWSNIIDNNIEQRYQIIIEEQTSNIWFNYLDVVKTHENSQAGATNSSGLVSFNILDSEQSTLITGLVPAVNSSIKLINERGGKVTLSASVKLNEVTLTTAESKYNTLEGQSIDIPFSSDELNSTIGINHNNSNFLNNPLTAKTKLVNVALYQPEELSLNEQNLPANGKVSIVNDNLITYTPNQDYYGEDTFKVNISDGFVTTTSALTKVSISPVNDVPTVNITSNTENKIKEKEQVTLTAQVSDIDSDNLSISWQQTSGPKVEYIVNQTNSISFTAPSITTVDSNIITFEVLVSDGEKISRAQITLTIIDSSGGSIGYLLLALFFLIRRENKSN